MNTQLIKFSGFALTRTFWMTLAILFMASFYAVAQTQNRTTVRGRVQRQGRPAARVRITLAPSNAPNNASPAYTGTDGMYYFRNVTYGRYVLEVWNAQGRSVQRFSIQVASQPFTDINAISIQ